MPFEFTKIMEHIFDLDGQSDPDYAYIEALMTRAAEKCGLRLDWVFDWEDSVAVQPKEPPKNSKSDNKIKVG